MPNITNDLKVDLFFSFPSSLTGSFFNHKMETENANTKGDFKH